MQSKAPSSEALNGATTQEGSEAIGEHMDGRPLEDPDAGKNPAAVALGKLGGAKGGNARAAKLSPRKRKAIAKKAAAARWKT